MKAEEAPIEINPQVNDSLVVSFNDRLPNTSAIPRGSDTNRPLNKESDENIPNQATMNFAVQSLMIFFYNCLYSYVILLGKETEKKFLS